MNRAMLLVGIFLIASATRAAQPDDSWVQQTDRSEKDLTRRSERFDAVSKAENQRHEERYLSFPPAIRPCFIVPEGLTDIAGKKWLHPAPYLGGVNWMFLGMGGYKFWSMPPTPPTHALNDDGSGPQIPDHVRHLPPPPPPSGWNGVAVEPCIIPGADPRDFERKTAHEGPSLDSTTWRISLVPNPVPQKELKRGEIGFVTWEHSQEGQTEVKLEAYSPVVNIVAVRPLRAPDDEDPEPSEVLDTNEHPDEDNPRMLVIPVNDDNDENRRPIGSYDGENRQFLGPKIDNDLAPVVLEPLRPMLKTGWLHLVPPGPVPLPNGDFAEPVRIFYQPQDADGNPLPGYRELKREHLILNLDGLAAPGPGAVPPDHPLRPLGEGRPVYLWIEGLVLADNLSLRYFHSHEVDAQSYAEQCGAMTHEDTLRFCIAKVDLDVDSDNNNGFAAPARTQFEDDRECLGDGHPADLARWPGKLLQVNCGDLDHDGIPDWRDFHNDSGESIVLPVAPAVCELKGLNAGEVEFMFEYKASPTDATAPVPGFRLWKRGSFDRNPAGILDGGDFIPPDENIPLSALTALYIEAVPGAETLDLDDCVVTVKVFMKDDAFPENQWVLDDAVRIAPFRIDLAMDGDRDDIIDFDKPGDKKYLFWVNDDYDLEHYEEDEWHEDDMPGTKQDCDDATIGNSNRPGANRACLRDLEDFTRLHLLASESLFDLDGITFHLRSTYPEVNLFKAINGESDYLGIMSVAERQIQERRLGKITMRDRRLSAGEVSWGWFLLEGVRAGRGKLIFSIRKDGREVGQALLDLDLRSIESFYERYIVNRIPGGDGHLVDSVAARDDQCVYEPETDEYLLYVHGWNVPQYEKDRWAQTVFKRLWWQGYRGHMGCFQWPTLTGWETYNRSEWRAWRSAQALSALLSGDLHSRYHGEVNLVAHSMGNVVVGEALRLSTSQVVKNYLAMQAAISGNCYDQQLPEYHSTGQPNLFGFYATGKPPSNPYLQQAKEGKRARAVNYFNYFDWALKHWDTNNYLKLIFGQYGYIDRDGDIDTYNPAQGDAYMLGDVTLTIPVDKYEIFSRCAKSRSRALGTFGSDINGFSPYVSLNQWDYDELHYSHSRQFRSNIIDEWPVWKSILREASRE